MMRRTMRRSFNRGRRFADADGAAVGVDALVPPAAPRSLRDEVARLLVHLFALPTPLLRYECLLALHLRP